MEGIRVHSLLGQPLQVEIRVSAARDELPGMAAHLADADFFSRTGLNYSSIHARLKVALEKRKDGAAIIIRSTEPINEPYLDLLVELNWQSGRLMRSYTVLLDPPEVAAQSLYQPAVVQSVAPPDAVIPPLTATQAPVDASAPKAAEQAQVGASEHVVKKGETLHRIAAANLAQGVTLEQMLVTIYRNNPDAFAGGNMNRLKQGVVLRIPDVKSVGVSQEEARKIFKAQTVSWNAYRRKLAALTEGAAGSAEGGRSASGGVGARVEEKIPDAVEKQDQVLVSRSNQAKGAAGITEEDLIAQEKRLQDSKDRVAKLEQIVADLNKLLKMKEQDLGDLQKQLKPQPDGAGKSSRRKPTAFLEGGVRLIVAGRSGMRDFSTFTA
ncbi:MAG: hypothetical protein LBG69_02620 [Zoogloeaceae bacterium]|nr:hypothetical protein [Zoogloeaceae bacterium]